MIKQRQEKESSQNLVNNWKYKEKDELKGYEIKYLSKKMPLENENCKEGNMLKR